MSEHLKRDYRFKLDTMKDVEVLVRPVEGDVELYVNPGFYLKDYKKSMYKLRAKANKRIIISKEDFVGMGLTDKVSLFFLLAFNKIKLDYLYYGRGQD